MSEWGIISPISFLLHWFLHCPYILFRLFKMKTKEVEIKRRLFLGRKVMTNLDSIFKSRDITLPTKVRLVKAMVFPVVTYGCESWTVKKAEHRRIRSNRRTHLLRQPLNYGFYSGHVRMRELDCEESWAPKNWCFWTVVLDKTLESPLDCKEIQLVHSEGDQLGFLWKEWC